MNKVRWWKVATMAVALSGWAGIAHADIIISQDQGTVSPDENVVYNTAASINGPALTVKGTTNNTGELIDITGTENLVATGGIGQATVTGEDGDFTYLKIQPDDPNQFFSEFELNLEVTANEVGSFTVTACNQLGDPCETATYDFANGNNFFVISVIDPQLIAYVTVQATNDVLNAKQLRVSLAECDPSTPGSCENITVPEPASMALMGLGLLVSGWRMRRKGNASV